MVEDEGNVEALTLLINLEKEFHDDSEICLDLHKQALHLTEALNHLVNFFMIIQQQKDISPKTLEDLRAITLKAFDELEWS